MYSKLAIITEKSIWMSLFSNMISWLYIIITILHKYYIILYIYLVRSHVLKLV